jgi:uncharacterized protein with von Willebrand factor type A (vWA) domain
MKSEVSPSEFKFERRNSMVDSHLSAKSIIEFCRFVRANGVNASTTETIVCLQAAGTVARADFNTFRFALRAILCSSAEEWVLFDDLFTAFWARPDSRQENRSQNPKRRRLASPGPGEERRSRTDTGFGNGSEPEEEGEQKTFSGASAVERLRKIDFSQMPQTDLAELERVSLQLMRRMSYQVTRRLRARKRRESIDLRRTIRQNICRGGELIDLRYRGPKKERAKLVLLLDVSDSMNPYSFFLLKFAYVLGKYSREVKSFVFSTTLVEVTNLLRARRMSDALRTLSQMTAGWSGGTRIGGSLRDFNKRYASALLSRHTVFIILSDGWDTGAPEELAGELKKIRRQVAKLIWLNPLLGLEEYKPLTRGINAALPFIDLFAPAHNLESLLALEKHLGHV